MSQTKSGTTMNVEDAFKVVEKLMVRRIKTLTSAASTGAELDINIDAVILSLRVEREALRIMREHFTGKETT